MTREELIEVLPKYGYKLIGDKWYNEERDMAIFIPSTQDNKFIAPAIIIVKYGYFTIRTAYVNFIKEKITPERDKITFNNGLVEVDLAVNTKIVDWYICQC